MKLQGLFNWASITKDWPQVLLLKLGIKKDDINLRMNNGLILKLQIRGYDSDTIVVSEMYLMKPYTEGNFKIQDNWNIVDIGANIGVFSTYAVKDANNVKVYAYEPAEDNFKYLVDNIKQNHLEESVYPYKFAVTKSTGKNVTLYMNPLGSGGNSLYTEQIWYPIKSKEIVKTISLEEIIKTNKLKYIDLLKIDCEGAEYEIILNIPKKILPKIKRIALEAHNIKGYSIHDIEVFLQKNGFKTYMNTKGAFCAEQVRC